jgi:uncharacterized protein YndB with AHSA1/START domain
MFRKDPLMSDATDDTLGISITRTFDAPRTAVFAAWTDPAQFRHWFGGAGTTVEDVEMDVRPGGAWSARMILGDGSEIPWRGTYQQVETPERLVLTLTDRPGEDYELVTVVLADVNGRTEMTFTQVGGHLPPEQYARVEEGWESFFDDLAAALR